MQIRNEHSILIISKLPHLTYTNTHSFLFQSLNQKLTVLPANEFQMQSEFNILSL